MDRGLLDRAHALAEETFLAGSGPGGQNVNKVATTVQLRVNVYALRLPPPVFARPREIAGIARSRAPPAQAAGEDAGQPRRQGAAAQAEESARGGQGEARPGRSLRLVRDAACLTFGRESLKATRL
jgi:ribosome-associated protein